MSSIKHINKQRLLFLTEYVPRTRVKAARVASVLTGYDEYTKRYLVNGFTFGFRVGCIRTPEYRAPPANHPPVLDNPNVAKELIEKELQSGRILGPFKDPPLDGLICSPLNLVPKAGNPGKFRLIHNLAYPYNHNSVNANIPDHQAVVSYAPFDKAVRICQALGPKCYIAKMDYDSAFRIFPISGQDIHLLGFTLNELFYINSTMAFGARSSCQIFETFATAMEWALKEKTGWDTCTHYLDDFFLARGTYPECATFMESFQNLSDFVGAQLSPGKTEGPATKLTFLGLQLDTIKQVIAIPGKKLQEASALISEILACNSKKVTIKTIQKVAGKLQFIAKGIPAGRPYLRRWYDLLQKAKPLKHRYLKHVKPNPSFKVKLTNETKRDLAMWQNFIEADQFQLAREVPFLQVLGSLTGPELYTDAAGSVNLGIGFLFEDCWSFGRWPLAFFRVKQPSIALLELIAIVVTVDTHAAHMQGRQIRIRSDNESMVKAINRASSKCKHCLALLWHLTTVCLRFQIHLVAVHMPGEANGPADALSRQAFRWFNRLRQAHFNVTSWRLRKEPTTIQSPLWPVSWGVLKKL